MPYVDPSAAEKLFRHKVLRLFQRSGLVDEDRTRLLLSWHHSGFSVHHTVTVPAGDSRALEALARYRLHNPVSLARLRWTPGSETATYLPRAGHDEEKAEVLDAHDFVVRLLAHVPDPRRHLVHYYANSNIVRGKPKSRNQPSEQSPSIRYRALSDLRLASRHPGPGRQNAEALPHPLSAPTRPDLHRPRAKPGFGPIPACYATTLLGITAPGLRESQQLLQEETLSEEVLAIEGFRRARSGEPCDSRRDGCRDGLGLESPRGGEERARAGGDSEIAKTTGHFAGPFLWRTSWFPGTSRSGSDAGDGTARRFPGS